MEQLTCWFLALGDSTGAACGPFCCFLASSRDPEPSRVHGEWVTISILYQDLLAAFWNLPAAFFLSELKCIIPPLPTT